MSGFFTSIPTDVLLRGAKQLIERAISRTARPWQQDHWWTVKLHGKREPIHTGRVKSVGAIYVSAEQLIAAVEHALEMALFQLGDRVFKQRRGALIVFPISAAICIAAVCEIETQAQALPPFAPSSAWMAARYVDNLLTIHKWSQSRSALPEPLQRYDFYGSSVLLEFESDLNYIGMCIIPQAGHFEVGLLVPGYQEVEAYGDSTPELVQFQWRYRTANASGSRQGLMSGFASRLRNAATLCYPAKRAREAVLQLYIISLLTVNDVPRIRNLLKKQAARFPTIYKSWFLNECLGALRLPIQEAISSLRQAVGRARHS